VVVAVGILVAACSTTDRSTGPTVTSTSGSSVTTVAPHPLAAEQVQQIDDLARAALGHGITGAVVGIVDLVRGSLITAYGNADMTEAPMQPGVHFRIASVAKTFTAQAIFDLAAQDRLSLSDTLDKYVPANRTANPAGLGDFVVIPTVELIAITFTDAHGRPWRRNGSGQSRRDLAAQPVETSLEDVLKRLRFTGTLPSLPQDPESSPPPEGPGQ
jgi:CubicO group peptidase (beta-lactamase class C family)